MEALVALVMALSNNTTTLAQGYDEYREICEVVGEKYDIDPYLLCGIAGYETEFDNDLVNQRTGVCCAMQIMPGHTDRPSCSRMLRDPQLCVETAAVYLTRLQERVGDDIEKLLCHYNCGNACYRRSRLSYVPGVLWTMDLLRRLDEVRPYGYYVCTVTLPMHKVTGEDTVLSVVGLRPVYAADGKWSGRDTIRWHRDRLAQRLKDDLRYRTCQQTMPEKYDDCIHAPGRSSSCVFMPVPAPALSMLSVIRALVSRKSS